MPVARSLNLKLVLTVKPNHSVCVACVCVRVCVFVGLACIRHDPVSQSYVKHDLKSNDGTPQIKLLPDRCDLLSDVVEPVWLFSLLFGTPASLSLCRWGSTAMCRNRFARAPPNSRDTTAG